MARKKPKVASAPRPYAAPIDRLLTLGCPGCSDGEQHHWRLVPFDDYAAMGIGPEHVPELRRLAFDRPLADGEAPGSYAPVHAARALGAMHPPEVLSDMIELTRRLDRCDDDAWLEDMPGVLACFGAPAIDRIARAALDNRERFGARLFFLDAIERIAVDHPDARDRVVAVLADMLKYAAYADPAINGSVIGSLVELFAAETLPAIRAAFATGRVDWMCCGRLESVEQEIVLTPDERSARRRADVDRIEAEYNAMTEGEALALMTERLGERVF